MDYAGEVSKLIAVMKGNKHPIFELAGLEKGVNGILRLLWINELNNGEILSPGEISSIQDISTGRIATTLKSLELKNYIHRDIDSNDRRRISVELTDIGRIKARSVFEEAQVKAKKIFEKIGDEDAREFIRILGNLANACEEE
ncbi:MAG: hypothetical protein GX896_03850 [Clostridiales bacterium]|nr:hypothetical protein [Clostridiales bacterium]